MQNGAAGCVDVGAPHLTPPPALSQSLSAGEREDHPRPTRFPTIGGSCETGRGPTSIRRTGVPEPPSTRPAHATRNGTATPFGYFYVSTGSARGGKRSRRSLAKSNALLCRPPGVIAFTNPAQPITPLALGVMLLYPLNPLLMRKRGELCLASKSRPPLLYLSNAARPKRVFQDIVPLINRHRRYHEVVLPRLGDAFGERVLTEQLIAVFGRRAVREFSQGFCMDNGR